MNFKDRIKASVEGYSRKQLEEDQPKIKREKPNDNPEERLVVQPLIKYMKERQWKVNRYESKFTWNEKHKRWTNSGVKKSTPDIGFIDSFGHSCWCEAKAPGRRSNWTEGQEKFILDAIDRNAFACVSDSVENFVETYDVWLGLRLAGEIHKARRWLTKCLPKKRPPEEEEDLF